MIPDGIFPVFLCPLERPPAGKSNWTAKALILPTGRWLKNTSKEGGQGQSCPCPRWRRWRDSNSRALIRRLPHFECGPFNRLGTSPYFVFLFFGDPAKRAVLRRKRQAPGKAARPAKASRAHQKQATHYYSKKKPCRQTDLAADASNRAHRQNNKQKSVRLPPNSPALACERPAAANAPFLRAVRAACKLFPHRRP